MSAPTHCNGGGPDTSGAAGPLLSVLTVTRNAAQLLPATLASVAAQTCTDYEHLIVDGASTDQTAAVVAGCGNPRVRFHSEPDSGIYDAMNRALGLARGRYVLFLNAGDRLHSPDIVERIAAAANNPSLAEPPGIIYGQTDIIDPMGRRLAGRHLTAPEELTLKSFAQGMVVCHQAFVALRKITGEFDLRYRLSADYDWCIACLQHSRRNVYLGCVVADYLREGASTRHRRRSLWERFRIMCSYYGVLPTLWRHLMFVPRRLKRLRLERTFDKPAR